MEPMNWCHRDEEILEFDPEKWPPTTEGISFTLRLESVIHADAEGKGRSSVRNMIRLKKAQRRQDIVGLSIHHSCCIDVHQLEAILFLINCDDRDWLSFEISGINEVGGMYSPGAFYENLKFVFQALRNIRTLKLHSSTLNRGHGLEMVLEKIPYLTCLEELCLEGWQIDRISTSSLMKSLQCNHTKSIRILSMRMCRFLGENSFSTYCHGLKCIRSLNCLDISYCNLDDRDIILLVGSMKGHPCIANVNLERNCCRTQSSVNIIAEWISDGDCKLQALNVGNLWAGYSEEGLMQRFVDPAPLFCALANNKSLCYLNVSENYLEDDEIRHLTESLRSRHVSNLCSLNVGVNPFNETGAQLLLELVGDLRSIQDISFENSFIEYACAHLIDIQAEANFFDSYIGKSINIPLSLWPNIFARIKQGTRIGKIKRCSKLSTDHIYRLLKARTGSYGKQLSFRIALHNSKVEE